MTVSLTGMLDDISRSVDGVKHFDNPDDELLKTIKAKLMVLRHAMRSVDHPKLGAYVKVRFKPEGGIRFFVSTGVFYDSTPGPESDAFIEMVNEFYRDHTELARLNCEEEA